MKGEWPRGGALGACCSWLMVWGARVRLGEACVLGVVMGWEVGGAGRVRAGGRCIGGSGGRVAESGFVPGFLLKRTSCLGVTILVNSPGEGEVDMDEPSKN